ncbi:mlr0738 [Mesorhizobium japonicum MAFF 303099]|uniref:Mlr0738 protein n=1 Tax=Mesorhizobium japonicum (strain LMG 29417 / CECT 9101 / MAFF 303099) TaxID=266835 RepID=Q98M45_RHILO|nr:mlr0738 [Mesorhizobium japonicum MAFF 303099]
MLSGRGEVHFGWVLEGRAIQDVWILPARNTDSQPSLGKWTFYGTTLRVYDPGADAWHIFWSDPRNQYFSRQLGQAEGDAIVQVGADGTGSSVRWSFSRITENSFRWLGERSHDNGATWRLEVEFLARRVATA